jgi:hypothetical protein
LLGNCQQQATKIVGTMTSKAKNGAYKILAAQKSTVTKITGAITPEAADNLKNEIRGIFTILKSNHYDKGQRYGYLACVIPENKYRVVIANNTWAYQAPDNPGAYAATALGAGVSAAQREQIVANHKEAQISYAKYLGAQEAGKELILYSVGDDALTPLKKQYINFGNTTIHSMIKHLRKKTAIKMTTSQKYDYKTEGHKKPWDPTMSITAYFTGLDKFQISLADRGISTSVEEKAMAAGARMWESKMFTEDQMVASENKPAIDQTWVNLQTYFTEKWLEGRQYSADTAKQSRFKEAALAANEQAAATEEGKKKAMMFALLQEQHQSQLEAMATTNKVAMEAMLERMNALVVTAQGGRKHNPATNKENEHPPTNRRKENDTKKGPTRRKKAQCPHCKAFVYHKPKKCLELEANKDKLWPGWKLIKAMTA